jgi:hypothetical protein
MKFLAVQLVFPAADDNRCETVTDEVGQRTVLMNLSTPSNKANDWIGTSGTIASDAASLRQITQSVTANLQSLKGRVSARL